MTKQVSKFSILAAARVGGDGGQSGDRAGQQSQFR